MRRTKSGEWRGKGADVTGDSTRLTGAAAPATGEVFGPRPQLPRGNRSPTQNGRQQKRKLCCLDDFRDGRCIKNSQFLCQTTANAVAYSLCCITLLGNPGKSCSTLPNSLGGSARLPIGTLGFILI